MRKTAIGAIIVIVVVLGVYAGSNAILNDDGSDMVITYGETTFNNLQYKEIVDQYFNRTINFNNATEEIITANEVNAISQGISNQTYSSSQIFSSALLDFNKTDNLEIDVDQSKITLVTEEMYESALESAGIERGYVIVTSPVSATGESALAGIMASYEKATNTSIPDDVKQAANEEIYAQSEVVNNSNVSGDDVADLMDDVKDRVSDGNITDYQSIVDLVNRTAIKNGMNLTDYDIDNLAGAIERSQSVKDMANDYKEKISTKEFSIFNIFNF